jgi:hypothetical protein
MSYAAIHRRDPALTLQLRSAGLGRLQWRVVTD